MPSAAVATGIGGDAYVAASACGGVFVEHCIAALGAATDGDIAFDDRLLRA